MQNCNLKFKNKMILEKAVDFHGHLGPYLVLGLLMGDLAIKRLKCKKHFGIKTIVKGAVNKPKSCLIDGIQISTGCTYGKGNILKMEANKTEVIFENLQNKKKMRIFLRDALIKALASLNGHKESETFAKELLKFNSKELFELKI